MTNTTQEPIASSPARTRHWLPWALLSIGIVVAVVIGAAFAASGGDDDDSESSTAPFGMMMQGEDARQACAQWSDQAGADAPSPALCEAMAEHMSSAMGGGQMMSNGQMMGSMMTGDVDGMIGACRQWMATTPTSVGSTTSSAWCTQMAEWMNSAATR
jgi:hypothetical protein